MEPNHSSEDALYWKYLINKDKSAAPRLEELLKGLAEIICDLESGPQDRLTPRRLASFYRSVGGDLDALFLRTSNSGLSFLYRTIGCFHSLEPSTNPFETPSTPCLTSEGFVKWQTVQILLCPEEHVRYLQEAVRIYDVPRPEGGHFPKTIPRNAFPEKADTEMEAWHKHVTSQLDHENMRRLKGSPYHSPYPSDRPDGYFSQPAPRIRRPSKPSRQNSRDGEGRSPNPRRSSEPDFSVPVDPVDHARNPHVYVRHDGNGSPGRPSMGPRQRSATTGHPPYTRPSGSSSRTSNERPPSSFFRGQYPERYSRTPRRSRSPSSSGESSAEDASSEDSGEKRKSRRSRAASSFLSVLPFTTPWSRRSQSHDASSYRKDKVSPRRDQRNGRDSTPPMRASTETFQRPPPSVRFRQDMFDNPAAASAPESHGHDKRPQSGHSNHSAHRPESGYRPDIGHRPDLRYARNPGLTEPAASTNYNHIRDASSGSGSERRSAYEIPARQMRKSGAPQRTATVTGVQGRKYANTDSAGTGPPAKGEGQPEGRVRYSLAV